MYTDDEIIAIALGCKTTGEVMKVSNAFRWLICNGFQAKSPNIVYIMVTRFKELI